MVAKLLQMTSADGQALTTNHSGMNTLQISASCGHLDVTRLLMKMQSGTEQAGAVDNRGNSALMIAAREGHLEIVNTLLQSDDRMVFSLLKRNEKGQTALDLAKLNGHREVTERLGGMLGFPAPLG